MTFAFGVATVLARPLARCLSGVSDISLDKATVQTEWRLVSSFLSRSASREFFPI